MYSISINPSALKELGKLPKAVVKKAVAKKVKKAVAKKVVAAIQPVLPLVETPSTDAPSTDASAS